MDQWVQVNGWINRGQCKNISCDVGRSYGVTTLHKVRPVTPFSCSVHITD